MSLQLSPSKCRTRTLCPHIDSSSSNRLRLGDERRRARHRAQGEEGAVAGGVWRGKRTMGKMAGRVWKGVNSTMKADFLEAVGSVQVTVVLAEVMGEEGAASRTMKKRGRWRRASGRSWHGCGGRPASWRSHGRAVAIMHPLRLLAQSLPHPHLRRPRLLGALERASERRRWRGWRSGYRTWSKHTRGGRQSCGSWWTVLAPRRLRRGDGTWRRWRPRTA
mmetsp:Transcript_15430/g.41883  ORF Transcript_15430/g.41883 Transcript_15430/m.41883 type:complete len:220 (+) Transcript_15430:67-726(+)